MKTPWCKENGTMKRNSFRHTESDAEKHKKTVVVVFFTDILKLVKALCNTKRGRVSW